MTPAEFDSQTREHVEAELQQLEAATLDADYDTIQGILRDIERELCPCCGDSPSRDGEPLVHDIDELLIEAQLQILRKSRVDAFASRLRAELRASH